VTGRNKDAIEDYFDLQYELEQTLRARNKTAELAVLAEVLPDAGATSFTRQQSPLGLGHAVWCARAGRQRAIRRAPARHADDGKARLPQADGRGLARSGRGRERDRGRGSAG